VTRFSAARHFGRRIEFAAIRFGTLPQLGVAEIHI
jgi:hypothetical protein